MGHFLASGGGGHCLYEAESDHITPFPQKGQQKTIDRDFLFMVEPVRAHRGASIAPTDGLWK